MVVCIFSLVGFESATALGGEARTRSERAPGGDLEPDHHRPFMVVMSYVEVFGARHYGTSLARSPRR